LIANALEAARQMFRNKCATINAFRYWTKAAAVLG
jgi:hypothetical protein